MITQHRTEFSCPVCGGDTFGSVENKETGEWEYTCSGGYCAAAVSGPFKFKASDMWKYFKGVTRRHFDSWNEFRKWDKKKGTGVSGP